MTDYTTEDNTDPDGTERSMTSNYSSDRSEGRSSPRLRSSASSELIYLRRQRQRRRESFSPESILRLPRVSSGVSRLIRPGDSSPERESPSRSETRHTREVDYDGFSPGHFRDRHANRQYRGTSNHGSIYDLGTESDEEYCPSLSFARTSVPPEWRESEHKFPDGSVTQLLSIHSAEHKTFRDKKEKIVLTCPDQENSSIKLRWLHIQNRHPEIDFLEKLVADCPWISLGLKAAALRLILRASNDKARTADWETNEQAKGAEEHVILLTADYLAQAGLGATPGADSPDEVVDSLLSYLYGDYMTTQREANLALRKLTLSARPDPLRVPILFCLSLGTGLLVTMSELSFADVKGDLIEVDDRTSGEFRTIHVKRDLKDKQARQIIIELDCKFADFHRRIVNIAATRELNPSIYDILWAPGGDIHAQNILTPARWIQLLSSERIEEDMFFLSRKHSSSSNTDRDPENYEKRKYSGQFGIWEESPGMPRDHHSRYKRRDTGSLSRPSTELFMSESGASGTTRSGFDQASAYGQSDQGLAGNSSPETTRSKRGGVPVKRIREWQKSSSVVEDQSPQSLSEAGLDLKRSEGTETEQFTREASPGISKLMITPGSLIPLFVDGRWFGIVPYNSQRLLTWSDDQVSTGKPFLDELQDRLSGIVDDDTNLDSGTGQDQTQTQTQPVTIHEEDDGIIVVTLEGRADEGHNRTMSLSRSHSRHGDDQFKESPDYQGPKSSLPTDSYFRHTRVREEQLENLVERMDPLPVPERNTSYERRRKGFEEASPTSSGLIIFPFFTWRVKHGTEEYAGLPAIRETDETVVRIFAKIHESITSDESSYKKLYVKAYRCTADDLFLRHPDISFRTRTHEDLEDDDDTAKDPRRVCNGKDGQSARGHQETIERTCSDVDSPNERLEKDLSGLQGGKGKQAKDSASAERDQTAHSSSDKMANPIRPGEGSYKFKVDSNADHTSGPQDSVEGPSQGLKLKAQLLDVSQSIFRAFLPSQSASSYSDYYHPLCERFWGSLDEIFRQITWSTTLYRDDLRCVIRDLDRGFSVTSGLPSDGSKKKTSFADCTVCQRGWVWNSPSDAMKHIHARHCDCTVAEYKDRLHDDPCSVWIKQTAHSANQESQIILQTQDVIELLLKVSGLLNEIQWLVASTARVVQHQTSRPQLPSSLVHAFDALLSYYIFTARQLSLMNRSLSQGPTKRSRGKTNSLRVQLRRADRRCRKVGLNVVELLANAKKSILLRGTKDQENDSLGLHVVGTHFLMAALVMVVQNRSPDLSEQGAVQTITRRSTDAIDMYKEYSSQLRLEANRRPQKRVVVAIHELGEELRALSEVVNSQESMLAWYMDHIGLREGVSLYERRRESYSLEKDYIEKQCERLRRRQREIGRLQDNAAALKLQVGWMIDILEEDHGKAIRVFTVVTLFFLPLSFVTSFMGMNTSDIRDMESNQRLFWSIAVPLTVFVLTAAFIYGYKGDEVADLIGRWLQSRVRSQEETIMTGPRRQTTGLSAESKDSAHETEDEQREIGRLEGYILRHRKSKAAREEDFEV